MNPKKLETTYNKIAEDYFKDHIDDTWDDDFIEYFAQSLPGGAKVLDLGCGPGVDTEKLRKFGLEVFGFDLSEGLLQIAKKRLPDVPFTQGDMVQGLPYDDHSFDGIFAKASLLHIPKTKIHRVFKEINRVVKPGGIVHIALKKGEGEEVVVENDYGYQYERFFVFWQSVAIEQMFERFELAILKKEEWQNPGKKTIWLKYLLKYQPMEKVKFTNTKDIAEKANKFFKSEKQKLLQFLPEANVEHVGGTAVPDSISKGDLDINVRVKSSDFEKAKETLKTLYAINQPDNWTSGFASFKDDSRNLGIQLTAIDSPDDRFVTEREYLKNNPKALSELNALKQQFEGKSMEEYRKAKYKFFERLDSQISAFK